jgi:hypothetical protein
MDSWSIYNEVRDAVLKGLKIHQDVWIDPAFVPEGSRTVGRVTGWSAGDPFDGDTIEVHVDGDHIDVPRRALRSLTEPEFEVTA